MPAPRTVVLKDWDNNPTTMTIDDNADSISLTTKFRVADHSIDIEVGIRLSPESMDELVAEVLRIKEARGL